MAGHIDLHRFPEKLSKLGMYFVEICLEAQIVLVLGAVVRSCGVDGQLRRERELAPQREQLLLHLLGDLKY